MVDPPSASQRWIRAPVIRAMDQGAALLLLGRDGVVRQLEGDSAALVRALLAFFWAPRSRDEVLAHVADLTGAPVVNTAPVDEAITLLQQCDALRDAHGATASPARAAVSPLRGTRVVLGLTGAIATMHAPGWVSQLLQLGCDVQVIATQKALRFVQPEALYALTHREVVHRVWQRHEGKPAPHITIAGWADIVIVCPASATTLSRLAVGNFADVVSAVAMTTDAPVVIAPSMNPRMLLSPAVQRNLETLRGDGFHLVHSARGVEVADAPPSRTPSFGPSPPFEVVIDLAKLVLARKAPRAPEGTEAWNQIYRAHAPSELPWTRDDLDADFAAVIDRTVIPGTHVLDAGTGHGVMAREAALRGAHVMAVDIAPAALDVARSHAPGAAITWVRGDVVTDVRGGRFDLILDRGCLHVLPPERHGAYIDAMAHALRPGGVLAVKVHALEVTASHRTVRFDREGLVRTFASWFEPIEVTHSTFPGPEGRALPAWFGVFRVRDHEVDLHR